MDKENSGLDLTGNYEYEFAELQEQLNLLNATIAGLEIQLNELEKSLENPEVQANTELYNHTVDILARNREKIEQAKVGRDQVKELLELVGNTDIILEDESTN